MGQGVRGGEVLPLHQRAGQLGPHCLNEPVDEVAHGLIWPVDGGQVSYLVVGQRLRGREP
jgi:hypothetical protein